jgi:transposase InsO family protein
LHSFIGSINNLNVATFAERPFLQSKVYSKEIKWLLDTGASISCLSEEIFRSLGNLTLQPLPPTFSVHGATGHFFEMLGSILLPVNIQGVRRDSTVVIVRNLRAKAILGMDFCIRQRVLIDTVTQTVVFQDKKPSTVSSSPETPTLRSVKVYNIPARSSVFVNCYMSGTEESWQGYATSDIFVIDSTLDRVRQSVFPVLLHNPLDVPLQIRRQDYVGQFHSVGENDCLPIEAVVVKQKLVKMSTAKQKYIDQFARLKFPGTHLQQFRQMLYEYADVISDNPLDLGYTEVVQHRITLRTKEPVHLKQFRIPEDHIEFLHKYVEELLDKKCIALSSSPYNAPIFCVKKPNGSLRIVQDLRGLNDVSYDDKYSIKEIQDCIDTIGRCGSRVFSCLDLTSGFWQQALHPDSQPLTAFTVPGKGRYHWKRLPMGLKGSPASFQRLMDFVMTGLPQVQCYIDDILIHSASLELHVKHLRECFDRLRKYGLKLNIKKCDFGATEIPYLGHIITPTGVKPSIDKLKAVRDFPEPSSVKQIREFCGLTNYFRNHIRGFALIAGHLTRLTRKNSEWKGGPLPLPAKAAYLELKKRLCSAPLLAYPRPNVPYTLSVDAATGSADQPGGLGAILSQEGLDGKDHVIAYASRRLKEFETNYTPFLLEMAAACWGIENFHVYLYGRKFTLLTDHRPLEAMSRLHQKTLNRLQQCMNEYNFVVMYRKGSDNEGPDALSRNPIDALEVTHEDFKKMQREDGFLADIIKYKRTGELPTVKAKALTIMVHADKVIDEDGLVYYMYAKKGFEPRQLIVVPAVLQHELIHGAHATRFSGHGGTMKTILRLQQKYYWPGMTSHVEEYVKQCITCQKCKGKVGKTPLQPISLPELPNQRCHMDLVGPLKSSTSGNKYVLAITDAFTKYAVVVAIPDKEAVTVAAAVFTHWICRFSAPKVLISDRGKEFCNQVMDELCVLMGIERRMTTVMHPQSNTAVESWNRSLIKYLTTAMSGGSTLGWEDWLPALALSYNTAVHKSTLQSPFYLTFLQHPNLPYFDMENPAPMYSGSWATEAYQRMQKAYRLAKSNNEAALQVGKEYYDRNAKMTTFKVGDRVLVHFPKSMNTDNKKFSEPWREGYVVVKVTGPVSYVVQCGPRGRPHSAPANRIRLDPRGEGPLPSVAKQVEQRQRQVRPRQDAPRAVEYDIHDDDDPLPVPVPVPMAPPLPPVMPPVRVQQQVVVPRWVRALPLVPLLPRHRHINVPEGRRAAAVPEGQGHRVEVPRQPLSPIQRLAQHVFHPVRHTRSRGDVAEQPLVKDSDYARKRK